MPATVRQDKFGFLNTKSVTAIPIAAADSFSKKKRNAFFCLKRISAKIASKARAVRAPSFCPTGVYPAIERKRQVDRLMSSNVDLSLLSASVQWTTTNHVCPSHECIVASQTIKKAGVAHYSHAEKMSLLADLSAHHFHGAISDLNLHPQVLVLKRTPDLNIISMHQASKLDICCSTSRSPG